MSWKALFQILSYKWKDHQQWVWAQILLGIVAQHKCKQVNWLALSLDIAKEEHDKRVILIKVYSICFEWFTSNDIVVVFCGHMYHLFCLFTHLQTSITCVV
jgi:hypothetical protein